MDTRKNKKIFIDFLTIWVYNMLSFKKASSKELRSLSDKDVMKFLEVCSKLREQFIEELEFVEL
jgi:hypothetical protein